MNRKSEIAEYCKSRGWPVWKLAQAMGYTDRAVEYHIRKQRDGRKIPPAAARAFEAVKNGERERYVA